MADRPAQFVAVDVGERRLDVDGVLMREIRVAALTEMFARIPVGVEVDVGFGRKRTPNAADEQKNRNEQRSPNKKLRCC